jgi:serine/threonine-protein kinase RsbW
MNTAPSTASPPRDGHCRLEMHLRADPARVAAIRKMVEALALLGGFDQPASEQIGLCLNEALANVIRHAYDGHGDQPIALTAEATGGEMRLSIRDWGRGVIPAPPAAAKDPLTPGGLGMICLKSLMDQVDFQPQPDGMLLTLVKRKGA